MRVEDAEYARSLHRWMVMRRDPSSDPAAEGADDYRVSASLLDESGKTLGRFDCESSGTLTRIGELIVAGRPPSGGRDCLVGLVDRDGKWVVQPEYSSITQINDAAWRDLVRDDPAPVEYLVTSALNGATRSAASSMRTGIASSRSSTTTSPNAFRSSGSTWLRTAPGNGASSTATDAGAYRRCAEQRRAAAVHDVREERQDRRR
ncbi:hypothetical protein VL15_32025 [Burkholderia cepacia]|uniref:Uncharacterized protein n=1 Tax=Burkholderia cepacia TaxID=292 RepID=A0A0J5ZCE2_BURCE|nr:WG repeat-containing protein [Burkholderia cepacia]KML47416.1 hypothetical protein VL15_32025 [Burkholderia cepacia]